VSANLIIDGQILQTSAWHRGMGKYLIKVLDKLSNNGPYAGKINLILNTNIDCGQDRYKDIGLISPGIKIIRANLPTPNTDKNKGLEHRYKIALEDLINKEWLNLDNVYIVTSLFYFDFCSLFPDGCRKYLLIYDLTPLLFWKDLGGYFPPDLYFSRFDVILNADKVLAISNTTRKDIVSILGLDPQNVVNINGGFTKISETSEKPVSFKVPKRFILFPTGDLPHKNNAIAVKGYNEYAKNDDISLLITSNFGEKSMESLRSINQNIIFTGNVTDDELEWLYNNAEVVMFTSKYEGLGLPILDAVANDIPIVASNISVFKEMTDFAFYFYNTNDYIDLSKKLSLAAKKIEYKNMRKQYPKIIEKYNWSNTANDIMGSIIHDQEKKLNKIDSAKPRIAVACIHPGIKDQIGRLVEPLYYSLSKYFDIDFYFDPNGRYYGEMERPSFLEYIKDVTVYDISQLNKYKAKKYDKILYLLDNNSFPSRLAQRAFIFGGYSIQNINTKLLTSQQKMFYSIVNDKLVENYNMPNNYSEYSILARDIAKYTFAK
jgi:hypothetical protein